MGVGMPINCQYCTLEERAMSIINELGPVILGSMLDLIQGKGLLWKVQCTHEPSPKNTAGESMDDYIWRYPQCKTMKWIRNGSFFQNPNATL